jgi:hypothetical protein
MDEAERLRRKEILWALPQPVQSLEPGAGESLLTIQEAGLVADATPRERWTPLSNGGGLGTALRGQGLMAKVGGRMGRLSYETVFVVLQRPQGGTVGEFYTGHVAYQSSKGWRTSIEQEPMRWGFGPMGGHLLGTSFQPFPKLRITTPVFHPTFRGWTLGRWQFDWFTGRMESRRSVPAWQQHYASYAGNDPRDVSRPFQSGARVSAEFCDQVQFNFGITSMWGGITKDGVNLNHGLKWYDFVLSSLAGQNTAVSEATGDPTRPRASNYHGTSNGIASFEIRLRSRTVARWLGAQGFYYYGARDGENINFQWKDYLRNPLKETLYDTRHQRNVFWNDRWHSMPSFSSPTHAIGCQVHWPVLQLGVEYRDNDTRNSLPSAYQTYENGNFRAGHSRLGDSMGFMLGGGYRAWTVALDGQPTPRLSWRAAITEASRPFKDDPAVWRDVYPDYGSPRRNTVLNLELGMQQRILESWRWGFQLGWRKEYHPSYGPAVTSSGNLVASLTKRF